jgi:hypothetical protein
VDVCPAAAITVVAGLPNNALTADSVQVCAPVPVLIFAKRRAISTHPESTHRLRESLDHAERMTPKLELGGRHANLMRATLMRSSPSRCRASNDRLGQPSIPCPSNSRVLIANARRLLCPVPL